MAYIGNAHEGREAHGLSRADQSHGRLGIKGAVFRVDNGKVHAGISQAFHRGRVSHREEGTNDLLPILQFFFHQIAHI